jgi:hypothetical protein
MKDKSKSKTKRYQKGQKGDRGSDLAQYGRDFLLDLLLLFVACLPEQSLKVDA